MSLLAAMVGALALAQSGAPAPKPSPEAWADPRLTVRDGLALWIDVSRQAQAYDAAGRNVPADGGLLGVAYDASGFRRDVLQRVRAQQPKYVVAGAGALVRFDGVDDALAATGLGATLRDFTLFVRAAPRANPGGFRGLVACNATGRNDYRSGFNLDLSFAPGARLDAVNVEGAGFGGAADLLASSFELGTFHTFTVEAVAAEGVALRVDGRDEGRRARDATEVACDEVTIGARFYSNDSDVPVTTGFLDGDVEEVLLFARRLTNEERDAVERYLADKHAANERTLVAASRLRRVALEREAPDPVRLFAPGFTATPLPVDLVNVNDVAFREDGTLVALGYDGSVFLLDDRDGDGVPESVRTFFAKPGSLLAPIGMALTPKGFAAGRGVVVACKQKIVLLADDDGDDVADREVVLASGWEPGAIPHNVDALGVAIAPDGRVLFGLGTSDYTNAYLVDSKGAGHYALGSERGTILEVAPDLKSRRIVCTGIRFPVGIHFNRAGDLFATDQEGATWLPDGNPFDELLHIEEGRHYGFPPRHPRQLPGVLDEPSLFDYRPQHQSTCGFCFNEPASGRPTFGPPGWEGDALIAGYSRGKLYRTELARSDAGYVARNQQLASFSMLVCDCALGPSGELIVACHSGEPDWGSGPTGHGRLFQLKFDGRTPQPVATWASSPQEIRVAFDRPLEPGRFEQALATARANFGAYVGTGDRFEALRPGYQAVQRQLEAPRFDLPLLSLQISADRRMLSLVTAPHVARQPHALSLPELELGYDLGGVEAEWVSADGDRRESIWLPHLDLTVARRFTRGSADHEKFWKTIEQPGQLHLRGALDLADLLRPEVQPGARLDHEWPDEFVTLELQANAKTTLDLEGAERRDTKAAIGARVKPARGRLVPFEIAFATAYGPPLLTVAVHTDEDPRPRALPLRRFFPPWAARLGEADGGAGVGMGSDDGGFAPRPELAGGNWSRGRAVFFGADAMCSKCHTLDDGGGRGAVARIGPDLSKLWQRDTASVRRDVLDPNAAINPDYAASHFVLRDGRELAGVARRADGSDADAWVVGEAGGKETAIRAGDVATREPLPTSIMPAGLQNVLSKQQVVDLLTYVLARPLEPSPIEIDGAPPPCRRAEFDAIASSRAAAADPPPLNVVLVAGPKDHGVNEHDYPDWQAHWSPLLARADGVAVATAQEWPSTAQLAAADVVVMFHSNPAWSAARAAELDAHLARGGGLVLIHFAVNGGADAAGFARRVGLAWRDGSKYRHGPVDLAFGGPRRGATSADAIVAGFERLHLVDETYWDLVGDPSEVRVLATAVEAGEPRPQIWTREVGRGRVVGSLPGHYRWTFDDPRYRLLLLRSIAWAGHQPVERLEGLATLGARVERE
jgi:putative heme-binding domain-containing protein